MQFGGDLNYQSVINVPENYSTFRVIPLFIKMMVRIRKRMVSTFAGKGIWLEADVIKQLT